MFDQGLPQASETGSGSALEHPQMPLNVEHHLNPPFAVVGYLELVVSCRLDGSQAPVTLGVESLAGASGGQGFSIGVDPDIELLR